MVNIEFKISADEAIKFEKSHFCGNGDTTNNITRKQRFITLAPESPLHFKDVDGIYDDTSSCTYDTSYHNFETGK